jgi:hypothetical protein
MYITNYSYVVYFTCTLNPFTQKQDISFLLPKSQESQTYPYRSSMIYIHVHTWHRRKEVIGLGVMYCSRPPGHSRVNNVECGECACSKCLIYIYIFNSL